MLAIDKITKREALLQNLPLAAAPRCSLALTQAFSPNLDRGHAVRMWLCSFWTAVQQQRCDTCGEEVLHVVRPRGLCTRERNSCKHPQAGQHLLQLGHAEHMTQPPVCYWAPGIQGLRF